MSHVLIVYLILVTSWFACFRLGKCVCVYAGRCSGVFPPSGLDWGRLLASVVSLLYEQS